MADISRQFVREQMTGSVEQYRTRVYELAAIYSVLLLTSMATIVLIIVKGKLFVTLSQRSNVETLTLVVVLVLFGYLAVVSAPGALGALKILWYNSPRWFGGDPVRVERRKHASLAFERGIPDSVYLNCLVLAQSRPGEPVTIPLEDEAGSLGAIRIDGAKMTHEDSPQHSSNSVFAFFEQRIQDLVGQRAPNAEIRIVQWTNIDDEQALQYASLVAFSRNLAEHLQSDPLWPAFELTDGDLAGLRSEAKRLCPTLRNEAYLPDVEYSAEHRLPIIPEPLAFISLSRQEQRADPVASMGCALIITLIIFALVLLFILFPPWVPGK